MFCLLSQVNGRDIICRALNHAHLNGLLTVFSVERSDHELASMQSSLPILSGYDKVGNMENIQFTLCGQAQYQNVPVTLCDVAFNTYLLFNMSFPVAERLNVLLLVQHSL